MIRLLIVLLFVSLCSAAVERNYTTQIKWSGDYEYHINSYVFHRISSISYDVKMINHSRFSYYTTKHNDPEHYITTLSDEHNSLSDLSTGKVMLSVDYKKGLTLVVRCQDKYSECIGNINITVEHLFNDFGVLDMVNLWIYIFVFLLGSINVMIHIKDRFFPQYQ